MPLIYRITTDMFEFVEGVDYAVNLVNLQGVSGAGIAAAFRDKVPSHIEPYRTACRTGDLRIGTVQVIEETEQSWGMINFPTKRHYQNLSDPEDIKRSFIALRELLQTDRYRNASIIMPVPGSGCGKQPYEIVMPMIDEYMSNLDATVIISMAPGKTDMDPRYLTIVGPINYARNEEECNMIEDVIDRALNKLGRTLDDYTGIISGGFAGTDQYIAGKDYNKEYEHSYVYRKTGKVPLVVKSNPVRNGTGASMHHNKLLVEVADDIIVLKPEGVNNNRLSAMQIYFQVQNQEREHQGLHPRRIVVWGERNTDIREQNVIVPEADIPY